MSDEKVMSTEEWDAMVKPFSDALRDKGFIAVTVIGVRPGNDGCAFVSLPHFKDEEGNPGVRYWDLWAALNQMHHRAISLNTQNAVSAWEQRILAAEKGAADE